MVRWINSISKALAGAVLVSVLSVYITWLTVHTYIETLLKQYRIDIGANGVTFDDVMSQLSLGLSLMKADGGQQANEPGGGTKAGDSEGGASSQRGGGGGKTGGAGSGPDASGTGGTGGDHGTSGPTGGAGTGTDGTATGPDGTGGTARGSGGTSGGAGTGAGGTPGSTGGSQQDGTQPVPGQNGTSGAVMSTDDFYKLKENLSEGDKTKIFSILAARLPQEKIVRLSNIVEDGISEGELTEVESTLQKYLKPEEFTEIVDILQKY